MTCHTAVLLMHSVSHSPIIHYISSTTHKLIHPTENRAQRENSRSQSRTLFFGSLYFLLLCFPVYFSCQRCVLWASSSHKECAVLRVTVLTVFSSFTEMQSSMKLICHKFCSYKMGRNDEIQDTIIIKRVFFSWKGIGPGPCITLCTQPNLLKVVRVVQSAKIQSGKTMNSRKRRLHDSY